MQKRSLGRGLSDLLAGNNAAPSRAVIELDPGELETNPFQPRHLMDEERLQELAGTIREQGILQPIIVRETPLGYQIVAGERRWRAAQLLDLRTVPCIVTDLNDQQMLQVALIENLARDDLNPIDEARAYKRLTDEFRISQEEVAGMVGKSRPAVANCLRLLTLPVEVQEAVAEGQLSEGHARALLPLRDEPGLLYQACERTIREGLSVRETEEIARRFSESASAPKKQPADPPARDPHLHAAAERLQDALATRVQVSSRPGGGGHIRIAYHDQEELTRLLDAIAPDVDL